MIPLIFINFPYSGARLHNEIHHNKAELIIERRAVNTIEALVSGHFGNACRLREWFLLVATGGEKNIWPLTVSCPANQYTLPTAVCTQKNTYSVVVNVVLFLSVPCAIPC